MRCSFSSPSFWYNFVSVSFGHTLFSEPCRLFSLSGSLIWPSCLLSVTSDLHLDCRVWQSYFLLFKSVFLTKQRILQSSPSVVLDGLPAFGVIELVGGLIFFKNLTTHKFLLSDDAYFGFVSLLMASLHHHLFGLHIGRSSELLPTSSSTLGFNCKCSICLIFHGIMWEQASLGMKLLSGQLSIYTWALELILYWCDG